MNIFEKRSKNVLYAELLLAVIIILLPIAVCLLVTKSYSYPFVFVLLLSQSVYLAVLYRFYITLNKLHKNQYILEEKEKALQESERNLKAFFDSSQDSIIVLSPERTVIAVNKMAIAIANQINRTPVEKGSLIDDFIIDKERLNNFKYNFKKALANEKIKTIRQSHDKKKWNVYHYTPILDDDGRIWAVALTITDVTKEYTHENALRSSEEMYRQVLNTVEDYILVKKEGSKYVWANQSFHEYFPMSLAQFSSFSEAIFEDEEYERKYRADDAHIFATGDSITTTEVIKNGMQKDQVFQILKSPIIDTKGSVKLVVTVGRNITAQFNKEEEIRKAAGESQNLFKQLMKSKDELAENEKRLRLIADNSIEMITLCTPDGEMLYLSPSTERLTGYKREELYNKNFADFFHPDDLTVISTEPQKMLGVQGKDINFTHRFLNKAGEYRWFSSILRYVYDEDGDVMSMQTSSRDSTDIVLAEMSLRASEAKFRELFNSGYDGILVFELVGKKYLKILETNRILQKMLEYETNEMTFLDNNIIKIEQGITGNMLKERILILRRDKFLTYETIFITKSGKEIPVEVVATLSQHEDKELVQAIARDITERRKIAQTVRGKELAERSLQMKSDFLASMSHEIRTPMNGIIGVAQMLMGTPLSPQQGILVKTLYDSGKNMLNILNEVLTLAKLESDKMTLNKRNFDFQNMIVNIRQLFKPLLIQKKSLILIQIDASIPRYLKADETKLLQVLTNLLSNAIKFTEKGKIIFDIEIVTDSGSGDYLLKITISDTGKGMSKASMKHLFERFYQVEENDNTKSNEGSGLGLSICKGLVTLWGGEIGAESIENKGSTFWFTIPVKAGEYLPPLIDEKTDTKVLKFENLEVLVVEDKKINQEVARMMLENIGCTVAIAENGLEGYQTAKNNRYDLVLMDIFMPIMDGIAATKKIKQDILPTPIIIGLSANTTEEDSQKYIKQGMDDYLAKPIDMPILSQKIAKWFPQKVANQNVVDEVIENYKVNEKEIIQIEVVERIRAMAKDNMPYLQNLYQSLAEDMENLLKESHEAVKNNEKALLTRHIHTIKGLSATIGMSKMEERTTSLYTKLKADNFENLEVQLEEIEKAYLQSLPLLRQAFGLS